MQIAWAGSPTSQTIRKPGEVIDIDIGQTADIAANVIDTTAVIDLDDALWLLDNAADLLYMNARLTSTTMAAGESLTVTIDVSADGAVWDGDASASQVMVSSETMMIQLVEWARFIRFRILNQDDSAHDYDVLFSCQAK